MRSFVLTMLFICFQKQSQHYLDRKKLDKACFHHNMAYGDCKDFKSRTLLIKYYVIKRLLWPKIQNMMDNKELLLLVFINICIKSLILVVLLKVTLCQTNNYQMNCTSQLLKKLKNVEYINLLEITYGIQI